MNNRWIIIKRVRSNRCDNVDQILMECETREEARRLKPENWTETDEFDPVAYWNYSYIIRKKKE